MTTLRIQRLPHSEGLALPAYETAGSAGMDMRAAVAELFERHAIGMEGRGVITFEAMDEVNRTLRRMERYWTDQIRSIY